METNKNHARIDDTNTTIHIDFEKVIDLSDNYYHQLIQADGELPMVVEETQGYSDDKLVRCNNILVCHMHNFKRLLQNSICFFVNFIFYEHIIYHFLSIYMIIITQSSLFLSIPEQCLFTTRFTMAIYNDFTFI